jgi:pyridoxal phosphate enzyme (YggS family)
MSGLAERLKRVEERLQTACARAGRARADVTLVAVIKTVTVDVATELFELGVTNLGESRPQELWRKAPLLPAGVSWHLVGHLQRNKIERTLPLVTCIHSVDSLRLLEALEQAAARIPRTISVFLEVNASGEGQKHGLAVDALAPLVPRIQTLEHVQVRGLMTMAALSENPEDSRPAFRTLIDLRDRLHAELRPPHVLEHLSMGMSQDFEVAIEEGATVVRLGTVLFSEQDA